MAGEIAAIYAAVAGGSPNIGSISSPGSTTTHSFASTQKTSMACGLVGGLDHVRLGQAPAGDELPYTRGTEATGHSRSRSAP